MKRIEKVASLIGLKLIKENGESFSFGIEDIKDITNSRLEGKQYSVINLNNGYSIYHRNTAQCTFYQVFEPINWVQEEIEVVEEVVEIPEPVVNLDPSSLTFDDGEGEDVEDFYKKDFIQLITLENEHAMVFGFIERDTDLVYVPIDSKDNMVEFCQIYRYKDINPIITEATDISGDLVDLKLNKRKFDTNVYELSCKTKEKIYSLNKQNTDMVIKVKYKGEDKIAFVDGNKVIVPIVTKTSFFEVINIIETDLESLVYEVVYKKYVKQKATSGVTDIDYTDVFSYFKY